MTADEHLPDSTATLSVTRHRLRMYAVQAAPVRVPGPSSASSAPYDARLATMSSRVPIGSLLRSESLEKFPFHGRNYYRFRNETYNFPADDVEYERLDIVHQLIYEKALNNQLYLAHLTASPRTILDVGFGTGFWMLEVEKKYPHAQVIGIDLDGAIQTGQIPDVRCQFKSPVDFNAPQWPVDDSSVDLVHMAQLAGSVPDWLAFYRKAYRCLRPGSGYIEHVEIDWAPRTTESRFPDEAIDLHNWWHWVREASRQAGKPLALDGNTEDHLEQVGFRDVSHRRIRIPLFWNGQTDRQDVILAHGFQMAMGHTGTQSFHGFSMLLLTTYLNWPPEHVQRLCDSVVQIIQSRANFPRLHINLHVWTARKPQT